MGFSVTAANVIFFIAVLTAGSAAMDAWWDSTADASEARAKWSQAIASEAMTSFTLFVNQCNSGCNPATVPNFDVRITNTGNTVIDALGLTFLIDGLAYTSSSFFDYDIVSPTGVGATSLILPGEVMEIDFVDVPMSLDYANDGSDVPIQATTIDGVVGRR